MLHVTAKLQPRHAADSEPRALVTGVFDSYSAALAARIDEETVFPITWSRTARRPRAGETLPTTRAPFGLVAVVLPR